MRNLLFLLSGILCLITPETGKAQRIIFLHHSTGAGVYNEGNVEAWINNYNTQHSTDYAITERNYPDDPYRWANYPYDYWNLWINNACSNTDEDIECLNSLCANYDVIIFKHCFPGASITSQVDPPDIGSSVKTVSNYQLQYRALRDLMDSYPNNHFIVWTLAPLHRLATSVSKTVRVGEFVDWVRNDWLTEDGKEHPNIHIFDFFGYVAEHDTTPVNGQLNTLKYDFEISHTEDNSHPNKTANEYVGPLFAQFIVNSIEGIQQIKVIGISVTGAGGASSITAPGGTLQLASAITPENATDKSVTWSILNGTGQASINAAGLVTATADGTATATATAKDGSGVTGTLPVTISNQTVQTSIDDLADPQFTWNNYGDELTIRLNDDGKFQNVYIHDLSGRLLINQRITQKILSLDISPLHPAVYIVSFSGEKERKNFKLVKP